MTAAQEQATLAAIAEFIADKGYPPSIGELGRILGLSSASSVHARLKALEDSGAIERVPGQPRAIRLNTTTREDTR